MPSPSESDLALEGQLSQLVDKCTGALISMFHSNCLAFVDRRLRQFQDAGLDTVESVFCRHNRRVFVFHLFVCFTEIDGKCDSNCENIGIADPVAMSWRDVRPLAVPRYRIAGLRGPGDSKLPF